MIKKVLGIANCFRAEFREHLSQSEQFLREYEWQDISTYQEIPDQNYLDKLRNADVIISQNVKSITEYTQEYILRNKKNSAIYIPLDFWRFDGFWCYGNEHKYNNFWFPSNEFGDGISFNDYMNYPLKPSLVLNFFSEQLEKFESIDKCSSISMLHYFKTNYKHTRVFSDHWHPMSCFYQHLCNEILSKIGIDKIDSWSDIFFTTTERYRIIINSVSEILSIEPQKTDEKINFLGEYLTVEEYWEFSKYLHLKNIISNEVSMVLIAMSLRDFLGKPTSVTPS